MLHFTINEFGVIMDKKRTVQRISNKKRGRPKIRFNFMVLVIITAITFALCFILYMIKANISGDALDDKSDSDSGMTVTQQTTDEQPDGQTASDPAEEQPSSEAPAGTDPSIKYPLPASAAMDASYFENCCLITDSTLLEIGKYSDLEDVLGSSALNAANCMSASISSTYGNVTAYQTIQLKKPMNLYLMLGSDIGTSTVEDMISSYTTLVSNLHNYLPDMKIYVMQIPPAPSGSTTATPDIVDQYNSKLLDMAKNLGVYCIDTNTALRSSDGTIDDNYWDYDSGKLTEEGYKAVSGYILTHTA